MPTGRAIEYRYYSSDELKSGVRLEPPTEAYRAYLSPEVGLVRYLFDEMPQRNEGFPLHPDKTEEFDTDLQLLHVVGAAQDAALSVYYYTSA